MRDHLRKIAAFDQWANRQLIDMLNGAGVTDAEAWSLMAHIGAAKASWLNRIEGPGEAAMEVWPSLTVSQIEQLLREVDGRLVRMMHTLSDEPLRLARYTNSHGQASANTLTDIVTHLVNHGSHHRGQVCAVIRGLGSEPLAVDYMAFCRQAVAMSQLR